MKKVTVPVINLLFVMDSMQSTSINYVLISQSHTENNPMTELTLVLLKNKIK